MSDTIAFSTLMANLSGELRTMADRCRALEDAAMASLRQHPPDGLAADVLIQFQHLDHLTQALADLVRLVEAGGAGVLSEARINCANVRAALRMTSLADRLLGDRPKTPVATTATPADFLL